MSDSLLKNVFEVLLSSIIPGANVCVIDICVDFKELGIALAKPADHPVILFGFTEENRLRLKNQQFSTILSRPRAGYLQLPCDIENLEILCKKLTENLSVGINIAAEKMITLSELEKKIAQLKHLIDFPTPDRIETACREARDELGWTGSEEEIISQISNFKRSSMLKKEFSGKIIPGVFCDLQGTLLDHKGEKINTEILELLRQHECEGKTISIWTGANVDEFRQRLIHLGIDWPLLSKYDFEGCVVEIAVDDVPAEKLEKDYGLQAQTYVHWDPDDIWK